MRHAGYSYSGPTAAYAYKCVDAAPLKRIFILGPSHHVYLNGCALSSCECYETPLGNLQLDLDVIKELKDTGHFSDMSVEVDEDEHSIEMHLPYIYKVMDGREFKIVPILVGSISTQKEQLYGRILSRYMNDRENLFVVSSDFCHWGSRFNHTPHFYPDKPIHESIEATDREGMKLIERVDAAGFASYLSRTKNTICGRHPIGVFLHAMRIAASSIDSGTEDDEEGGAAVSRRKRKSDEVTKVVEKPPAATVESDGVGAGPSIKFVRYAQSSSVTSKRESSVSYASAFAVMR
ncbi:hypothetical protein HK101_010833 [Irineochytrium annulatum]|nr:hypothetical protein HK101_010833 [Irineochytrium annulatum]